MPAHAAAHRASQFGLDTVAAPPLPSSARPQGHHQTPSPALRNRPFPPPRHRLAAPRGCSLGRSGTATAGRRSGRPRGGGMRAESQMAHAASPLAASGRCTRAVRACTARVPLARGRQPVSAPSRRPCPPRRAWHERADHLSRCGWLPLGLLRRQCLHVRRPGSWRPSTRLQPCPPARPGQRPLPAILPPQHPVGRQRWLGLLRRAARRDDAMACRAGRQTRAAGPRRALQHKRRPSTGCPRGCVAGATQWGAAPSPTPTAARRPRPPAQSVSAPHSEEDPGGGRSAWTL
mmetsp:Transcript_8758/g.28212  ORF Transcript_8758/g.28212 Transcript_8758/m.28212 type:complete len:290 (+) Transcript_8758:260-1129(+)|eukprot:scaffold3418_cov124-Isochrysis_galbana.AAC.36